MFVWIVRTDSDYNETAGVVSPNISSVEQAITRYANRHIAGIDDWHLFTVQEWEVNNFAILRTRFVVWTDETLTDGGIRWLDWGEKFIVNTTPRAIEVRPR